jgi:hypothetical protein
MSSSLATLLSFQRLPTSTHSFCAHNNPNCKVNGCLAERVFSPAGVVPVRAHCALSRGSALPGGRLGQCEQLRLVFLTIARLHHDTGNVGVPVFGAAAICARAWDLASASWMTPCRTCCSDASSTFVKDSYKGGCSCCNPATMVNGTS